MLDKTSNDAALFERLADLHQFTGDIDIVAATSSVVKSLLAMEKVLAAKGPATLVPDARELFEPPC